MRSLLLVTCAEFADGDADDRLLIDPLAASNVDARFAVWNDPTVDWTHGPAVLRSTWDYPAHREDFLAWIDQVPHLHNAADVVRWNADKVYLAELAEAGVPVTPTTVVRPGESARFPDDGEFVVKPSVGAGSRGVGRFQPTAHDAARRHVEALHAQGRTALVQPYVQAVDEAGETALMYFGGRFSHAVRKGPMLPRDTVHDLGATTGLFVDEQIDPREPSADELAVAGRALAFLHDRFGRTPVYARIDLLPGRDGPVVIELELIEPSLFLRHAPDAAELFAACLAALA